MREKTMPNFNGDRTEDEGSRRVVDVAQRAVVDLDSGNSGLKGKIQLLTLYRSSRARLRSAKRRPPAPTGVQWPVAVSAAGCHREVSLEARRQA